MATIIRGLLIFRPGQITRGPLCRQLNFHISRARQSTLIQEFKDQSNAEQITPQMTNNIEHPSQKFNSDLLLSEEDRKDFFRLKDMYTMEKMIQARVHLGHKETMLDPHMRPYIYGKRLGVLIFDLEQTSRLLTKALNVTAEIAYRGGLILFISNSRQNGHLVEDLAKECGEYAYCRKWRNQIFSNSHKIFGTVTRLPDLVVLFNALNMSNAVHRAVIMSAKLLIPTVAICDTNTDPRLITYPVPGNDDTPQSIEFYCNLFKKAVLNGKAKRKEIIEKYGDEFYNKTLESS